MSPLAEQTVRIVQEMAPDLLDLVGPEAWPALAAELARLDAEWAAAEASRRVGVAAAYRTALARYPAARQRLAAALGAVTLYEGVLADVAALAEQLDDAPAATKLRRLSGAASPRLLFLKEVGEPARSIKLANLEFDLGGLALAAAGILNAVADAADPTKAGLQIAAAVLLILAAAYKLLEKPVSIDDASVFHGLIAAAGPDKQAPVAAIVAATNDARRRAPLKPLTEEEVRVSLGALRRLKAIHEGDGSPDVWRIVEDHGRVK